MTAPSWPRIAAYALPALPAAALAQPFYMFAPTFYAREVGLPLAALTAALLALRFLDAGADLAVGVLSDRTRSRFGRRRTWVLASAPLAGLAAFAALSPPDGAGLVWFTLASAAVAIAWAMLTLPLNAWGAELTGDYGARNTVTAWREGFTLAGGVLAIAAVSALSGADGALRAPLAALGLFALIAAPLCALAAFMFAPDPSPPPGPIVKVWDGLRAAFANRAFTRVWIAYLVNGVANGLPASLFLFFVSARLDRPDLQGPLLGLYALAGLLSIPFWAWLGGRWSKHQAWCAAMVWACGVFLLALLVDGPQDAALFAAISALSGLALGADVTLPASMQADAVDAETAQAGGTARTGFYFALWSVATKAALGLAAALGFGLLALAGFQAQADSQTPRALAGLTLAYAVLPVALKAIAIWLMWGFPISKAVHAANRARIEAG